MTSETFNYNHSVTDPFGAGTVQSPNFGSYTLTDTADGTDDGSTSVGDNMTLSSAILDPGSYVPRLVGTTPLGVVTYLAGRGYYIYTNVILDIGDSIGALNTTDPYTYCFLGGTMIGAPGGEVPVEYLKIGDKVRTADGRDVAVKWVGEQKVRNSMFTPESQTPVCIAKGALGDGLPHSDLFVSADHGMMIDGLVVNAAALVNGATIRFVPMAEMPPEFTYYHIETEAHDAVLANGAAAETFIDMAGRAAFDNHAEYLELYGAERLIPAMERPRISSARLLPEAIKARLAPATDWDAVLDSPEMTVSLQRGAA